MKYLILSWSSWSLRFQDLSLGWWLAVFLYFLPHLLPLPHLCYFGPPQNFSMFQRQHNPHISFYLWISWNWLKFIPLTSELKGDYVTPHYQSPCSLASFKLSMAQNSPGIQTGIFQQWAQYRCPMHLWRSNRNTQCPVTRKAQSHTAEPLHVDKLPGEHPFPQHKVCTNQTGSCFLPPPFNET